MIFSGQFNHPQIVSAEVFGLHVQRPELPAKPKDRNYGEAHNRRESPNQTPLAANRKRRLFRLTRFCINRRLHVISSRATPLKMSIFNREVLLWEWLEPNSIMTLRQEITSEVCLNRIPELQMPQHVRAPDVLRPRRPSSPKTIAVTLPISSGARLLILTEAKLASRVR